MGSATQWKTTQHHRGASPIRLVVPRVMPEAVTLDIQTGGQLHTGFMQSALLYKYPTGLSMKEHFDTQMQLLPTRLLPSRPLFSGALFSTKLSGFGSVPSPYAAQAGAPMLSQLAAADPDSPKSCCSRSSPSARSLYQLCPSSPSSTPHPYSPSSLPMMHIIPMNIRLLCTDRYKRL